MGRFESYSREAGDDEFKLIAKKSLVTFDRLHPEVIRVKLAISATLSECTDPAEPPDFYHSLYLELEEIEEERDQAGIIAIVFTAMYFDAFIYDYSASCLGDRYTKKHLDKLDFLSKWLVIPKLVTGKSISKGGQAYESLKRLMEDRNALVHLKSRPFRLGNIANDDSLNSRMSNIIESTKNCRLAFNAVIQELAKIDPEHPKILFALRSHNEESYA